MNTLDRSRLAALREKLADVPSAVKSVYGVAGAVVGIVCADWLGLSSRRLSWIFVIAVVVVLICVGAVLVRGIRKNPASEGV